MLNFSGSWTSADGQQNAKLDFRTLRFGRTGAWNDLKNHTYLLGQEMQFISENGFYPKKENDYDPTNRFHH